MTPRLKRSLSLLLVTIGLAACSAKDGSSGDGAGGDAATSGGAATGGTITGGAASGAAGGATGGQATGGSGGATQPGGDGTGGDGSGGGATGGTTTGGATTGGNAGSTASQGGQITGGQITGGTTAGGSGPGGEATSGGAAGEPAAGGFEAGSEAAGGGLNGGTTTGGATTGGTETGGDGGSGGAGENGWALVWSDEFDGTAIDAAKWEHEVNCWGGGNNEDQCYVSDAKNSFVEDGMLHLVALDDSPSGPIAGPENDPTVVTRGHSSARLRTLNRGDFRFGRVEARMRLPFGQGLWPAFWMLPTDSVYGGWAASGEIDIMEAVNLGPDDNVVYGTLHYGGAWPDNTSSGSSTTPSGNAWESFHVYAIEWEQGEIRWFVDDRHYLTQTNWRSDGGEYPAPFDQRFHLLLNVAVGGNWPGPPDATTTFPQEMVVDYVRVYECAADPDQGHGCGTADPAVEPL